MVKIASRQADDNVALRVLQADGYFFTRSEGHDAGAMSGASRCRRADRHAWRLAEYRVGEAPDCRGCCNGALSLAGVARRKSAITPNAAWQQRWPCAGVPNKER